MDRRQILGAGAAALGLGAVGYALFSPISDEEMIAQVLDELGLALSFSDPIDNPLFFSSSLTDKFESIFTEKVAIKLSDVSVRIPDERSRLGFAAGQALSRYGSLNVTFSVDDLTLSLDTAHCQATARVAGVHAGELRTDARQVKLQFSKQNGDWLIRSAEVHRAN